MDAALKATIKLVCTNVAEQFKANIEKKESEFDFKAIDITGISHAVHACQGGHDHGHGHQEIECARAIVEIVELIDPTGITTIAAAFMHGTCEGV